jgi:hypothetical protein
LSSFLDFQGKKSSGEKELNAIVFFNPLHAELNPICHLLALLGVHHFLHVSRIRVKQTDNVNTVGGM